MKIRKCLPLSALIVVLCLALFAAGCVPMGAYGQGMYGYYGNQQDYYGDTQGDYYGGGFDTNGWGSAQNGFGMFGGQNNNVDFGSSVYSSHAEAVKAFQNYEETINKKNDYDANESSLIEIFTQKDGKVEKIYKRLSYGTTADDTVELTSIEIYSGATELYGDTVLIFCCRADYGDSFYIYGIDKYSGYLFLERYYILEYDMNEIDYVVISVKMGDGGGNEKFIGEDEFKKWWSSLKLEKNIFFDDDVQTLSDLLRQLKS